MKNKEKQGFSKKIFEFSYMLCRLAARLPHSFAESLESSAVGAVAEGAMGNEAKLEAFLSSSEAVLRLAVEAGHTSPDRAEIINRLAREIRVFLENERIEDVIPAVEIIEDADGTHRGLPDESIRNRQSAIVALIKRIGNCRMKDIIDSFPNVSERTLRYDLQNLSARKEIERIGNGGPSTFYRLPDDPNKLVDEVVTEEEKETNAM